GLLPEIEYKQEKLSLQHNDLIFCYTDGITEYFDKHEEEYGEERLQKFIKDNHEKELSELVDALSLDLEKFAPGEKAKDDITVLMLRKK
ncbi:MAG: serine/threonine-protein phosphatase, partial [Patescibacteria group bacterium]|nr:serine/threonine-protein phosphatase [Patescibacteria group bacterium]